MLDWLEIPELRRECQAGLNKGAARHTLAKAESAHSQNRIYDRSDATQQKRPVQIIHHSESRHKFPFAQSAMKAAIKMKFTYLRLLDHSTKISAG